MTHRIILVGSRAQYETLVSEEDYDYLVQFKWTFGISHRSGVGLVYVRRCIRIGGEKRTILLHRVILERAFGHCPTGCSGDHYPSRNTLDNRRENLRWATHKQQRENRRVITPCTTKPAPENEIPF